MVDLRSAARRRLRRPRVEPVPPTPPTTTPEVPTGTTTTTLPPTTTAPPTTSPAPTGTSIPSPAMPKISREPTNNSTLNDRRVYSPEQRQNRNDLQAVHQIIKDFYTRRFLNRVQPPITSAPQPAPLRGMAQRKLMKGM